jgi:hypothetical protein
MDGDYEEQIDSNELNWQNRFYIYANEVITQVSSTIKPKRTFYEVKTFENAEVFDSGLKVDGKFYNAYKLSPDNTKILDDKGVIVMYKVNTLISMPREFISFGDDVCTIEYFDFLHNKWLEECHDDVLSYCGYNQILCKEVGTYRISYNARWYTFTSNMSDDVQLGVVIPIDILECIPSYIASQCYKVDDEYKSSVFRNEYEMLLARIDDTNYKNSRTFRIGGDW